MNTRDFQAEYEELQRIVGCFQNRAQIIEGIAHNIEGQLETLRVGFSGANADKFFAEVEQDILPRIQRMQNAFQDAGETTRQIVEVIQQAEANAANLFQGSDGAQTLVVLPATGSMASDSMMSDNIEYYPAESYVQNAQYSEYSELEDEVDDYQKVRDQWLLRAKQKIGFEPDKNDILNPFDGFWPWDPDEGQGHYQWRVEKEAILMWYDETQRKGGGNQIPHWLWDIISPHNKSFYATRDQLVEWLDSLQPDYTSGGWELPTP